MFRAFDKLRLASGAVALSLLLSACTAAPAADAPTSAASEDAFVASASSGPASPASSSGAPSSPVSPGEAALPAGFTWAVEPSLQAEDIQPLCYARPLPSDAGGYGALGLVSSWPLAAICQSADQNSEAWGLIDLEGRTVTDCIYRTPFVGFDGRLSLSNSGDGSGYFEWEYLEDGTLSPIDTPEITGTSVNPNYLWRADESALYIGSGQDGFYAVSSFYGSSADPAYSGLAWYSEQPIPSTGPYEYGNQVIVLQNGQPVGEPLACDDFATVNFSCGVAGICQNGQWGLVNADGTWRLDCAYNAMFPASEDTVVLYQDGQPGLYGLTENAWLIEPGAVDGLEELRPMVNGRLFARSNGLWGVLAAA